MRTRADSPTKACGASGCDKPLRARGLCSNHYNQSRYTPEQRHPKATATCSWCGKACIKAKGRENRYPRICCSLACRDSWRAHDAGTNLCAIPRSNPSHPDYVLPLPVPWKPATPKPAPPRRWVGGYCHVCGKDYLVGDDTRTARYCSLRCAKRVDKQRYRARKRNAYVADVSPARIYQRDGWRCQICRRAVNRTAAVPHPRAPVIDHIVPLAQGGTHEPANVQCAHFMCNSIKRDVVVDVQLMLVG